MQVAVGPRLEHSHVELEGRDGRRTRLGIGRGPIAGGKEPRKVGGRERSRESVIESGEEQVVRVSPSLVSDFRVRWPAWVA